MAARAALGQLWNDVLLAPEKAVRTMRRNLLGVVLVAVFVGLSLLHVYWAVGGLAGRTAAVPSSSGVPLFRPSSLGTLLVASCLLIAAVIAAGAAGWFGRNAPIRAFRLLMFAVSLVFVVRAVGDWNYVGFFQRASESAFSYWDLRLYSPLCLFIGVAGLFLARSKE